MRRTPNPCAALLIVLALVLPAPAGEENGLERMLGAGRADELIEAANRRAARGEAEAFYSLCRTYLALENWHRAAAACERAVAIAPDNSIFHMWVGRAYGELASHSNFLSAMGLARKARDQFLHAIQLNPDNVAARSDLAEFQIDAPGILGGGTAKARAGAERLLASDPPLAHFLKSRIAEKEKNYAAAELELQQAIATSSDPAREWTNLASFYERRGRLPQMLEAIEQALAIPSKRRSRLYESAEILFRSGQSLRRATELLREYLAGTTEAEAPAFRAHYLLGNILEKQKRIEDAIREYAAALEHAREYDKARQRLAALKRAP